MKKYLNILCIITMIGFLCFGCKKKESDNSAEEETETVTTTSDESKDIAETTKAVSGKTDETTNTYDKKETLINPGVGVGKIKFGMTVQQMKDILGKPDVAATGISYMYTSLGIEVVAKDKTTISSILCGNPNNINLPVVKAMEETCKFKTAEGIGIGSTKVQIIKAFGQPMGRRDNRLLYKDKRISFTLADGKKVIGIWVGK